MKTLRTPSQEQAGALIAMAAVLFGGWVRLQIPSIAGFPPNDGGLFYVMVQAIQTDGLRIPAYVQYNGLHIPFAYPPLGLYLTAAVASLFHVDVIRVMQWLPAAVLVVAIPAFYVLAKAVLGTSFRAGLATLIFAFTPRAITWQIMGGGITRSFGQVFLLLAWAYIFLTFANYSRKNLILAILFSSLVVLSHPEDALQAAGIAVVFWVFKGHSKRSALHAAVIGAGTLILAAIWWLPLALGPGLQSVLAATQTGLHNWVALFAPFLFNFTEEPLISIAAILGMIGFFLEAAQRRFLLPLWFILPFAIEPRSAATTTMIPLAMLAGLTLSDLLLPALSSFEKGRTPAADRSDSLSGWASALFLLFIGLYLYGAASLFEGQVAGTALSPGVRQAFAWVKANTAADSRFLVLTGNSAGEFFCDAPVEWFPALTNRVSMTTIQGREWLPRGEFQGTLEIGRQAAGCVLVDGPVNCLEQLRSTYGSRLNYDHLFVARSMPSVSGCRVIGTISPGEKTIEALKQSAGYSVMYENADVAVFSRQP
jgi:hypothetical protein